MKTTTATTLFRVATPLDTFLLHRSIQFYLTLDQSFRPDTLSLFPGPRQFNALQSLQAIRRIADNTGNGLKEFGGLF